MEKTIDVHLDGNSEIKFTVQRKFLRSSDLFKNFLDTNKDISRIDTLIENENILGFLSEYLEYHHENVLPEIPAPLTEPIENYLQDWDIEFLKRVDETNLVVTLLTAASVNQVPGLVNLLTAKIATDMERLTPEEILEVFRVVHKLTPKEYREKTNENNWGLSAPDPDEVADHPSRLKFWRSTPPVTLVDDGKYFLLTDKIKMKIGGSPYDMKSDFDILKEYVVDSLKSAVIDEGNAIKSYTKEIEFMGKFGTSTLKEEVIKELREHLNDEIEHRKTFLRLLDSLGIDVSREGLASELADFEPNCPPTWNHVITSRDYQEELSLVKLIKEEECATNSYKKIADTIKTYDLSDEIDLSEEEDEKMEKVRKEIEKVYKKELEHRKDLENLLEKLQKERVYKTEQE